MFSQSHRGLPRWAAALLPIVLFVAVVWADLARRPEMLSHLTSREKAMYGMSALLGTVLWSGLVLVAVSRRGAAPWLARAMLIAGSIFALGSQFYTYGRYHAYLTHRSMLVGTSVIPSLRQQLRSDPFTLAMAVGPPLLLAVSLPMIGRALRLGGDRRARLAFDVALLALVLALFASPASGEQAATPDILYLSALGQFARAHWVHDEIVGMVFPGARSPLAVPPVSAKLPARNLLLILTESVRATSACIGYDPACVYTPFSNAAAPLRFPLRQMRSLDSTTAVSLATMWSGLAPEESRAAFHSAPLLWEYAHAANMDTAYWTSQNMLFGNAGAWLNGLPLGHSVSATDLDPEAEFEIGADDGKMIDFATRDMETLREPFVGVVHLSNTHFPYKIDLNFAPFLPQDKVTSGRESAELVKNRYQDAIYLQDRAVGRFLRALRNAPRGARTVVVFFSDHGEQLREKGVFGHTASLYDQEIHIPAWIDAPPGTLTAAEEASLRALENTPLTTLDVFPTLLDLMGLWDEPRLAAFRSKMPGESLLRGGSSPEREVFLTNCSELAACAFKNWGSMRGTKKLIGKAADHAWSCFDVATDPEELHDLGAAACGDLVRRAESLGHGRPF